MEKRSVKQKKNVLNKTVTVFNMSLNQDYYNDQFGCCICLGPKLRMITGHCQHRICEDCLYIGAKRRPCMQNCPVCGYKNSFPEQRPIVPQTTLQIQEYLGVMECPNKCSTQLWSWELEDHLQTCGANHKERKTSRKSILPSKKQKIRSKSDDKKVLSRVQRRSMVEIPQPGNYTTRNSVANRENIRSRRRQQSAPLTRQNQSGNEQCTISRRVQSVSRTSETMRVNTVLAAVRINRRSSRSQDIKSSPIQDTQRSSQSLMERRLRPRMQLS